MTACWPWATATIWLSAYWSVLEQRMVSLTAGCGSDDAAQPAADLPDALGEDRFTESPATALVGDRSASQVDGAARESVGGALGDHFGDPDGFFDRQAGR